MHPWSTSMLIWICYCCCIPHLSQRGEDAAKREGGGGGGWRKCIKKSWKLHYWLWKIMEKSWNCVFDFLWNSDMMIFVSSSTMCIWLLLIAKYIENTRWVSFDIKFTVYQVYQARLRECLLTSRGLPSDSTCIFKAVPGKLDIKRQEPGILFISLPCWFTLQTSENDIVIKFLCWFSVIGDVFQKCNVIMTW